MQSENTQVCPTCFRSNIAKLRIHEEEGTDRIVVTEYCGFCRNQLSQRESTNEIERVRRDINRLRTKVNSGESYLRGTLEKRIETYNRLRSQLS